MFTFLQPLKIVTTHKNVFTICVICLFMIVHECLNVGSLFVKMKPKKQSYLYNTNILNIYCIEYILWTTKSTQNFDKPGNVSVQECPSYT